MNVSVHGNAYTERNLLGVAYVIEQGTKKRKPVSQVNPSMYRCAKTVPAPPFAERGSCNPGYAKLMDMVGKAPSLGFSLETESAKSLQERMTAGTLSAETLTRAYLARIALTNAEGPATQAVRSVNGDAISDAKALDRERARKGPRGPLHGIPVLVDDSIGVKGMPTTGGSIALQESKPERRLGDRGQADRSRRDHPRQDERLRAERRVRREPARRVLVAGRPGAAALRHGQDAGRLVRRLGGGDGLRPGGDDRRAGDVARHGAADRAGRRGRRRRPQADGRARQPRRRAAGRDVAGLAGPDHAGRSTTRPLQLQAIAGADAADPATAGAPAPPNYLAGLVPTALSGKRVAVTNSTAAPYPTAVAALQALGATTVVTTVGTPSPNPPSIVRGSSSVT